MYCTKCGKEIRDDVAFCPYCGAQSKNAGDVGAADTEIQDALVSNELELSASQAGVMQTPKVSVLLSTDEDDAADTQPLNAQTFEEMPAVETTTTPIQKLAVMPDGKLVPVSELQQTNASAEGKEKNRRPFLIALIVALAAVLVTGVLLYTYQSEMWGGKTLPDVTGQSAEAAMVTLEDKGFTVQITEVKADEGIDSVLSMDPQAGKRVSVDTPITLGVAAARTIPAIVGGTLDEATDALNSEGATNVQISYTNSDQPEGTVLSVSPIAGSQFKAADAVVVTIAQPYTVPDVVGHSQDDAVASIEASGLIANVVWADSDQSAYTVLSTDPVAGTRSQAGATVTVTVASPGPRDIYHLADYFDCNPTVIPTYLSWKGFSFGFGYTYSAGTYVGMAKEAWKTAAGDVITFTAEPFSHHNMWFSSDPDFDALAQGAGVAGIRLAPNGSLALCSPSLDMDTINTYVAACGFDNMLDSCTQSDIVAPGHTTTSQRFICAYGETGGYDWTVMVRTVSSSGNQVIITCAPTSLYSSANLSSYGSICDYVAYIDNYTE